MEISCGEIFQLHDEQAAPTALVLLLGEFYYKQFAPLGLGFF